MRAAASFPSRSSPEEPCPRTRVSGLQWWTSIPSNPNRGGVLVHGGTDEFDLGDFHVLPWFLCAGPTVPRETPGAVVPIGALGAMSGGGEPFDAWLAELEAEAIEILREGVAVAARPVMLYSIGKDSSVLLRLARKAFWPGPPPFPLLHIDTTWKFRGDDLLPGSDSVGRWHGASRPHQRGRKCARESPPSATGRSSTRTS